MTGDLLKSKLRRLEPKLTNVAHKLGISKQALDAKLSCSDVKTGFIEQLAAAYNCSVSFFFDENCALNISHSPNSAASVNGNAIVYTADEHELIRLREENRQLYERIAELKKINDYLMSINKFPCS